jgi:glutamate N-acetyltransferase/amino-acid N-acetyltransferase
MKPASKSQPDLVLVASETPSCGAVIFTKNEFPAASVTVSRDIMRRTKGYGLRGVVANSGYGNTFTGNAGLEDAAAMSTEADKYVSGEKEAGRDASIMVMHTGVGAQR